MKTETINNSLNKPLKIDASMDFAIGGDWAITRPALTEVRGQYRTLPDMVARIDQPQALEAYQAKYLDNTFNVRVRDGVAIISISGPIFPNFNWYMYYYGGTCLSWLMKDIQAAIDNPNVFAILFKVDSPGGMVGGINEMGKYIYAASKKIPMMVFVENQCCSAALWLSVMAGTIMLDETSQIGSLGVCTTYYDDSKLMEKIGIEEIPIVSSQSPYKNLPPTTDQGLARVQSRLNYICNIFGENVALGRGVPIETVWKDFGQGDVLIGQQAIDVELADDLGTQEDCIALLSKTHAPHLFPGDDAYSRTLNYAAALNSKADEEVAENTDKPEASSPTENLLSEETINQEKVMSIENKENPTPAATTENEEKAAEDQPISAAEAKKLREELAQTNTLLTAEREGRVNAEAANKKAALEGRMSAAAAKFVGNEEGKKTAHLVSLADKFGEDSAEVKFFIEDQNALAEQVGGSDLFKEKGKDGSGAGVTAKEKLNAIAEQIAADEKVTPAKARTLAYERNPKLYDALSE